MHDQDRPMAGHEYDGIQELDNRLPRWWVWLFNLTIVWSAGYLVWFHVLRLGPLQEAAYRQEVEVAQARARAMATADQAAAPAEAASTEQAVLARGQEVYTRNCIACHGPQGQGLIGPNLTDDAYIHGPAFTDQKRTIAEGVPAKGMLTWKTTLKPDEIQAVASFVWSLRGTHPPNPKAPEGTPAS